MNLHWLSKTGTSNTDIQVRLCRDERRDDEDITINKLDIYVTGDY